MKFSFEHKKIAPAAVGVIFDSRLIFEINFELLLGIFLDEEV